MRGPNRFWTVTYEGTEVGRSDEGILLDTGQLVPTTLRTGRAGAGAVRLAVSPWCPGDEPAPELRAAVDQAERDLTALQDKILAATDRAHAAHSDPRPYCPDPLCRLAADLGAEVSR